MHISVTSYSENWEICFSGTASFYRIKRFLQILYVVFTCPHGPLTWAITVQLLIGLETLTATYINSYSDRSLIVPLAYIRSKALGEQEKMLKHLSCRSSLPEAYFDIIYKQKARNLFFYKCPKHFEIPNMLFTEHSFYSAVLLKEILSSTLPPPRLKKKPPRKKKENKRKHLILQPCLGPLECFNFTLFPFSTGHPRNFLL